ncbi:hypothetical protein ACG33_13405 [Steroidobacter denitrificans]|uniref:Uncharacterized protein n=1 Tax=Steroidobacter denitrificans TaxID=465721 RepID=A0A127FE52_STEDE|nr:hypothetical protein [Steroidobacter denitrificans]AMN48079.1 hypothetical protein ACG33_13405 [Steroidobacter denitrificans]
MGFFINSGINNYIKRRRTLLDAQVKVLQSEHRFLKYDSWLDCSDVHAFTRQYLDREVRTNPSALLGRLSPAAQAAMLNAVNASYTLAQEHITWIGAAFSGQAENSAQNSN